MRLVPAISAARAGLQAGYPLYWVYLLWIALALSYPGRPFENAYVLAVLLPFLLSVGREDLGLLSSSWVIRLAAAFMGLLFMSIFFNAGSTVAPRLGRNLLLNFSFLVVTTHLLVSPQSRGPSLMRWLGVIAGAIGVISIERSYVNGLVDQRFSIGEWANINTGSAILGLIAVGLLATAVTDGGSRSSALFNAAIAAFLIALVVATGSRAPLLGILASIAAVALAMSSRRALLGAFMLIALIGCLIVTLEALNVLVLRSSDGGRLEVWSHYVALFSERMLFGYGLNNEWHFKIAGSVDNPHNMLLAALLYGGILSGLMLVGLLVASATTAFRAVRIGDCKAPLAMVAYLVTHGQFEAVLPSQTTFWVWLYLWLPVAFAACAELTSGRRKPDRFSLSVVSDAGS